MKPKKGKRKGEKKGRKTSYFHFFFFFFFFFFCISRIYALSSLDTSRKVTKHGHFKFVCISIEDSAIVCAQRFRSRLRREGDLSNTKTGRALPVALLSHDRDSMTLFVTSMNARVRRVSRTVFLRIRYASKTLSRERERERELFLASGHIKRWEWSIWLTSILKEINPRTVRTLLLDDQFSIDSVHTQYVRELCWEIILDSLDGDLEGGRREEKKNSRELQELILRWEWTSDTWKIINFKRWKLL